MRITFGVSARAGGPSSARAARKKARLLRVRCAMAPPDTSSGRAPAGHEPNPRPAPPFASRYSPLRDLSHANSGQPYRVRAGVPLEGLHVLEPNDEPG